MTSLREAYKSRYASNSPGAFLDKTLDPNCACSNCEPVQVSLTNKGVEQSKLTFASNVSSYVVEVDVSPGARVIIHEANESIPAIITSHVPSLASHGIPTVT